MALKGKSEYIKKLQEIVVRPTQKYEEIIQKKAEEICSRQGAFLKAPIQKMMALKLLPQDTDIDALSSQITTVILGQLMLARIQNNLTNLKHNLRTSLFQTLNIDHEKD